MSSSLKYDLETANNETSKETRACSLCWLEERQVERYLLGVSNDGVNNIPLRLRLAKKGGYCPSHTEQFVKLAHALSSGILLESFLKQKLQNAEQGKRPIVIQCEACEIKDTNRKSYAKSIQRVIKQEDVQSFLLEGQLCMTHIQLVSHRAPRVFATQLNAQHDQLMQNLAEFVRKYDYRVVGKEHHTEDEKASLQRALALIKEYRSL